MVSIGHIGQGDLCEGFHKGSWIGEAPYFVGNAVRSSEVEQGCPGGQNPFDTGIDAGPVAVSQEDRAGVGTEGPDEVGAVVFLDLPGLFVLADDVIAIVVNMTGGNQAGLGAAIHDLLI